MPPRAALHMRTLLLHSTQLQSTARSYTVFIIFIIYVYVYVYVYIYMFFYLYSSTLRLGVQLNYSLNGNLKCHYVQ